jgi:DNA-binding Lrp family transcriptional regulator
MNIDVPRTINKKLASWEINYKIFELRKAGASNRQIAKQLGIAESNVFQRLRRVFNLLQTKITATIQEERKMDLERLDSCMLAIWNRCRDGDVIAIRTLCHIIDLRARLLGTYAPTRIDLGSEKLENQVIQVRLTPEENTMINVTPEPKLLEESNDHKEKDETRI